MSTSSGTPSTVSSRPNEYFDLNAEARADDQYIVEKILARRKTRKGKWEYLLKWAGFSEEDNTWELEGDIHPDLIADFERQQLDVDKATSIYATTEEDPPLKNRKSSPPATRRNESLSPAKKKKKISNDATATATTTTTTTTTPTAKTSETKKKVFGVEKGWRVRAVIGAAKQKDSSVIYAVDYVQGSPILREYVPSEIAHIYIPRELIEFFQRKIVWNSGNDKQTKSS